jgi:hypothetical protein
MSLLEKVVYRHIRNDNNSVFYVGMGTETRPYAKSKRSDYWTNIVNKYGYIVEILSKNLSFEDAIDLEMLLIEEYGRLDLKTGILCNLTSGGEGTKNVTESVRKKISESRKGVRNLPLDYVRTKEHCEKLSLAKKGKESTFKGKKHTEETKAIIKEKRALQIFTKETRLKKSESVSGGKNPFANKILDLKTNKIYETMKIAAEELNIKYTTLSAMLNGHCKNNTNLVKYKNYEFIR